MQNKTSSREEYQKRVNIIVEHINNNLDHELNLNTLAELSHFSPYHFHRIVRAFLGEPIGAYITRIRVETAARLLRYSDLPVNEIAANVGYDVPSSLTKAFKQYYGISPIDYRNNKEYIIINRPEMKSDFKLNEPTIVEIQPKKAIYIHRKGNYSEVDYPGTWKLLWKFVMENNLFSNDMEHIGMYHDDPKVTEPGKLRTDICLAITKPAIPKGEVGVKEIAGGKYVVFNYKGSYQKLEDAYNYIYANWLPDSGYELRNIPMFEIYRNNPADTNPEDLQTAIYLPIQ